MRLVIQRVSGASVTINNNLFSSIHGGMLILVGIETTDNADDISWLAGKVSRLRIFDDDQGVMNCSITEKKGELLVVSQFTLHASTKKGNRPSYIKAAPPEMANKLYLDFVQELEKTTGLVVKTGKFGAMMEIALVNDGPVTILIDSKNRE
jgi:D-tyrosyl-tRNA(Tyr) deacylase